MTGLGAKRRVLFLCVHNSARSQMAEGLLRARAGNDFEAHSAGNVATEVRPLAIAVMAELGIDISGQRSKGVDETACLVDALCRPSVPGNAGRLRYAHRLATRTGLCDVTFDVKAEDQMRRDLLLLPTLRRLLRRLLCLRLSLLRHCCPPSHD